MRYISKEIREVKFYCGDELFWKWKIITKYEFEQDAESGKCYLCGDGIRIREIFPKTEK